MSGSLAQRQVVATMIRRLTNLQVSRRLLRVDSGDPYLNVLSSTRLIHNASMLAARKKKEEKKPENKPDELVMRKKYLKLLCRHCFYTTRNGRQTVWCYAYPEHRQIENLPKPIALW